MTGSGKTEVYLSAMERVRDLGRRSLIIIPEISFTPQLLDRLNARFPDRVGVLHSALTGAQRWSQWRQISGGLMDVVIGARSAVFAPIPDLGLIVVDEEHDRLTNKRKVSVPTAGTLPSFEASYQDCPVILGSATPALESYENCRQGRYKLLELAGGLPIGRCRRSKRSISARSPRNFSLRFRNVATGGKDPDPRLISAAFAKALTENLQAGRQTLIF